MTTILWNLLWVTVTAIIFFIVGVMAVSVPRTYKLAKFINNRVNSRINSRMIRKIDDLLYMYMNMIIELNATVMGICVVDESKHVNISEEEREEISRLMELIIIALAECKSIIHELKESNDNKRDTETVLKLEDLYDKTASLTGITKYFVEKGDSNE